VQRHRQERQELGGIGEVRQARAQRGLRLLVAPERAVGAAQPQVGAAQALGRQAERKRGLVEGHRLGLQAELVVHAGGLVLQFGVAGVLGHEGQREPPRALEVTRAPGFAHAPGRVRGRTGDGIRRVRTGPSETRLPRALVLHGLEEHRQGAHPMAGRVVEGSVQHHRLERLAVPRHDDHLVLTALVVAVAARGQGGKGRKFVGHREGQARASSASSSVLSNVKAPSQKCRSIAAPPCAC
jgi:hypothetical protein